MTAITRCLIANRGEIAVRLIRACRERGTLACAVYSDADAGALFVRMADHATRIGGPAPADSYLNIPALINAARTMACDAVHPGYGFLSENADFAQAVQSAGLIWIGPPPAAMRAMGSKTAARALMQAAGVPVAPGFQPASATDAEYAAAAASIGYPLLVKAAAGGGGRGIRRVDAPDDLRPSLAAARREAGGAFGDAHIFLEKFIDRAHHIEVQIVADAHGNVLHAYERECSAQRRQQKVIEEAPAPLIGADDDLRGRITTAAVEAARAVGYVSAGTVEFIAERTSAGGAGAFYFLEMNTRLQVEHPVTEWTTGLDLVQTQFAIAEGARLPITQAQIVQRGHALEARLYAEDARANFAPSPGRLLRIDLPAGPGVRVDAGFASGDSIPMYYDALIAKITAYDATREGAIRRLAAALDETVVVGVTTNLPLLRALIVHPAFITGQVDTRFLDRELESVLPPPPDADLALIAAALLDLEAAPALTVAPAIPRFHDAWDVADSFRAGG